MIRGASYTIDLIFNAEYDVTRVKDIRLTIGNYDVCSLADGISNSGQHFLCYIPSDITAVLPVGERSVTLTMDDTTDGVRKAIIATIPIQNTGSQYENENISETANMTLELTYMVNNISADLLITDVTALRAIAAAAAAKVSEDNAKVSEDNAKESETNAAQSESTTEGYMNTVQGLHDTVVADAAQVALDRIATGGDAAQTALDRIATGQDAQAAIAAAQIATDKAAQVITDKNYTAGYMEGAQLAEQGAQAAEAQTLLYKNAAAAIVSGGPRGVYATAAALISANPDHAYTYVVTADGKWYYWNGSTFADGGAYQTVQDYALNSYADSLGGLALDFSILTSNAGAGKTYIQPAAMIKRCMLKTLRVKTVIGSTVTPRIYQITGASGAFVYTLIHEYPSIITTSLETTITITDTYIIEPGYFIGVKSTGNFYYKTAGIGGYEISASIMHTLSMAFDYVTQNNVIKGKVDKNTTDIAAIYNVPLKPCLLYQNKFANLTDFTNESTAWSVASNEATPNGLGTRTSKYLWLKRRYHIDELKYCFQIKLYSDTVFTIDTDYIDYKQGDGLFKIDIPNSKIQIFNRITADNLTLAAEATIPAITSGRYYNIVLQRTNGWTSILSISDTVTPTTTSVTYSITDAVIFQNRMMDSLKFYQDTGATMCSIKNLVVTSLKNPTLWVGGDSITEGYRFDAINYEKRYAIQLKRALKGNVLISSRGGASLLADIQPLLETEVAFVKPEYVMLTIGTNNGIDLTLMTTVVNRIIELGANVIINHVPNRADGSHVATNANIDTICNTTNAILGAKFDIVT